MSEADPGYFRGLFLRLRPESGSLLSVPHGDSTLSQSKPKQNEDILLVALVSLLTLTTFFALFALRSLDDNRLTSWQWTVAGVNTPTILFVLVVGIFLAYLLSTISLPVRKPAVWLFVSSFAVSAVFWAEPEVI
ncbi:MAG: hypothetical protein ACC651_18180, partial [Candidatus Scalindua sp.]